MSEASSVREEGSEEEGEDLLAQMEQADEDAKENVNRSSVLI